MHVLEEVRLDRAGRLNIAKVFDQIPERVLVLYDTEQKAIFFRGDVTGEWAATQRRVDSKNRVVLPKWMRDKLGDEFYVVDDSKEVHYLLIKKFFD